MRLETLLARPQPLQYLRPGLTLAVLQRIAATRSDTEAAQRIQQAKRKLFEQLRLPVRGPWTGAADQKSGSGIKNYEQKWWIIQLLPQD
jgi:hypothetical protein